MFFSSNNENDQNRTDSEQESKENSIDASSDDSHFSEEENNLTEDLYFGESSVDNDTSKKRPRDNSDSQSREYAPPSRMDGVSPHPRLFDTDLLPYGSVRARNVVSIAIAQSRKEALDADCSYCLTPLIEGGPTVMLMDQNGNQCWHLQHEQCCRLGMTYNSSCPICRMPVSALVLENGVRIPILQVHPPNYSRDEDQEAARRLQESASTEEGDNDNEDDDSLYLPEHIEPMDLPDDNAEVARINAIVQDPNRLDGVLVLVEWCERARNLPKRRCLPPCLDLIPLEDLQNAAEAVYDFFHPRREVRFLELAISCD